MRVFARRLGRLRGLAAAAALLAAACSSSSSTTGIELPTAIVVRAGVLTEAQGCGPGPSQVLKYGAVVSGCEERSFEGACLRPVALGAGVYDCFADATFVELPLVGAVGGAADYDVEVYLFNRVALEASPDPVGAAAARARAGDPAGAAAALREARPTWTTTCTATQVERVQSVATCRPLTVGLGAVAPGGQATTESIVTVSLAEFPRASGTTAACGTDYVGARATVRVDGAPAAPIAEQPCADAATAATNPLVIRNAKPSAAYEIALELLGIGGVPALTTTCRATTSAGLTSSAVCEPVR